jgi:uncharacterized protein YigE (DUF2233 family)
MECWRVGHTYPVMRGSSQALARRDPAGRATGQRVQRCRTRLALAFVVLAGAVVSGGAEPVCLQRFVAGPGLLLEQWLDGDGPWIAWVAHVDLRNPELVLTVRSPSDTLQGLALLSELCRAHPRAVLAVNGDYFDAAGVPVGIRVTEGQLLKTGRGWSYFAIRSDGRATVDRGEPRISLVTDAGDTVRLGGLNPPRPGSAPYVVSSRARQAWDSAESGNGVLSLNARLPWPSGRVNTAVGGPRTTGLASGDGGSLWLTNPPPSVTSGCSVTLDVDAGDPLRSVRETVGGGPRIVRSGCVSVEYRDEGTSESHALERHPRTAVGVSDDGTFVWITVVDGRRPGHSRGVDLYQLGAFMATLGCWDAVNLDGGGSSVMIFRGEPLTVPSDATGERPVANALLVFSREPPGSACRVRIGAPAYPLACEGLWLPVPWLEDAAGWRLSHPRLVTWSCDPLAGSPGADGYIAPRGAGWLHLSSEYGRDSLFLACEPTSDVRIQPPLLSAAASDHRSPVPVVLARSIGGSPVAVMPRVSTARHGVRVEAGELGTWDVPVIAADRFLPVMPRGPEFVVVDSLTGLPFDFSTSRDTLVFPIDPAPRAAAVGLELFAGRQGVHVAASFTDAAGLSYATELTSSTAGAYWDGWHEVKAFAADCTTGRGAPVMLPLRLQSLVLWPGRHQALAGTLWVRSALILPPG